MSKFVVIQLFMTVLVFHQAETKALSNEQKESLRSFVKTTMACRDIVGMSVTLVRQGETLFAEGFGFRDKEKQLPVGADTKFNIGSVSKAFTTTIAAEAVSKGALTWTQQLRGILGPEFAMQDDFSTAHANLRDLFAHRVGINSFWGVSTAGLGVSREYLTMKRFSHFPKRFDFRDQYHYSNYPFIIGAHVVENATGESWEDASRRYFQQLGMTDSRISLDMDSEEWGNTAYSYILENGEFIKNPEEDQRPFLDEIAPAAGVFSSAIDMAKWIKFHLAEGKTEDGTVIILSPDLRDVQAPIVGYSRGSTKVQPPRFPVDDIQFAYGLGWRIGQYRGYEKFYHTGAYSSYNCRLVLLPEMDVGVWTCVNSPGDSRGSNANYVVSAFALDMLLKVAECPVVHGDGICVFGCSLDSHCSEGRKCCPNACGQDCVRSVDSWLNETTACTYPEPWRSSGTSGGVTFLEEDADDDGLYVGSLKSWNPFTAHTEAGDFGNRDIEDFIGDYGHPAFGIFHVYVDEGTGNLRYHYGVLLHGELNQSGTINEFYMTVEYPLSYRNAFFPMYPNGYPVYFNDNGTTIDKVSVAYLEFSAPPTFEKGVTPA